MPDYDWEKIRQEYIADPAMSYRKLAVKYGVSATAVWNRGARGKWNEQRKQFINKSRAKVEKEMLSTLDDEVENILKARQLLTVRAMEMAATATRPSDIINLTNALQILARMTGVQSDLDTAEQKARIASIEARSQVQEEQEDAGTILIPAKEWETDDE